MNSQTADPTAHAFAEPQSPPHVSSGSHASNASSGSSGSNVSSGSSAPDASRVESVSREPGRYALWTAPLFAVLGVGIFALVVNAVRYGFAHDWIDPGGYLVAILKPLLLTVPAYLVLRVVLTGSDVVAELSVLARALGSAALSIAGFAPVVWFYLVTSPTSTATFPLFSLGFGALAFWVPLLVRLGRTLPGKEGRVLSYVWLSALALTETYSMVEWLASGIEGRL